MSLFIYTIVFLVTLAGMEFAAWFTHKYIMHGILWRLHRDHHTGSKHLLEHNDWFSLLFSIPSFLLIFFGLKYGSAVTASVGFGMAAYGALYFLVHDVFIHQRIKLFRNAENSYLKALRRAHRMHHKYTTRERGESFGFLLVSKKYFRDNGNLFDKTKS
ncbi:MAG: carotene hydroxylase [Bacteroidia bacterium]